MMRRWHAESHVMERRLRHWSMNQYRPQAMGRWRKRHPLDCGKCRCTWCHPEKLYGYRRSNIRRAAIDFELKAAT